jgi:segregation and condensation protein B
MGYEHGQQKWEPVLGFGQATTKGLAMTASAKRKPAKPQEAGRGSVFDRELEGLPQELRWRAWMGRIEAVLFASASLVGREDLARVVGQEASVELLIADIQAELTGRPYELTEVSGGWMFRTKTQFAEAIKAAADLGEQTLAFTEMEMGVLCTIAYHQPIDRAGLKDIFGKDVSRDLLARLRFKDLIASGPRAPRPGAPHTFVTTEKFLMTFDLQTLRDLPELDLAVGNAGEEIQPTQN